VNKWYAFMVVGVMLAINSPMIVETISDSMKESRKAEETKTAMQYGYSQCVENGEVLWKKGECNVSKN
jgi:hypothetical protein